MNNCAMRGIASLDEKNRRKASGTKLSEAIRAFILIDALYGHGELID
jgi:hypothetical protein